MQLRFESSEVTLPSDHTRIVGPVLSVTTLPFKPDEGPFHTQEKTGVRRFLLRSVPERGTLRAGDVSNRTVHSNIDGPGCELARVGARGMRCP